MPISVEARIWLATHLLYPNSTQAFDVFQAIVAQSERAIRNNDFKYLLIKLSQICEKIPAVSSSLSFHVFENKPIDEWRTIYRKSQKVQQLIVIGILVFEMPLEQVASALKMTLDKARFLFHQTFKKVVQQAPEAKLVYEFKYKKANDQKVSYLFTNENLIDYSLGSLTKELEKKVELGLSYYPTLQTSVTIYGKIIKQLKNLVNDQQLFLMKAPVESAMVIIETSPTRERLKLLNHYKKPISISTLSLIVLVLVFIRPHWLENVSTSAKNQAVVLLEFKKTQSAPLITEPDIDKKENSQPIVASATAVAPSAAPQKKEPEPKITTVAHQAPVVENPSPKSIENNSEAKKQGGLYRGVLVVTDLDEVTPKLVEKIVSLGGKKAGEVELGWKKSEKVGYYHFTLPQDNVESVNEFLKQFGKYKIVFENHPRLLPAGTKRFIIEVVEGE